MRRLVFGGATAAAALLVSFFVSNTAYAANPTIWPDVKTGIGLAASPVQLLVTVPFCVPAELLPHKVVSIDPTTGAPSDFFVMANNRTGCIEEKVAISPGIGGFLPNYVYVSQGPDIFKITPDGSSGTLFTHLANASAGHVAMTFDTTAAGAFGHNMIVTGGDNGTIYTVTSAGVATLLTTIAGVHLENGVVVTSGFWQGKFLVSAEDVNTIYAVSPDGSYTTATTTFADVEAVHVIPAYPPPTFLGSPYAFFEAVYGPTSGGHIRAYPATDFFGLGGKILASSEHLGFINSMNNDAILSGSATFDSGVPGESQESSAFVANIPLGCTFTKGWYKNRGSETVVPLYLGARLYTAEELLAILGANPGQYKFGNKPANGLVSLAQQLITEKLNALGGAAVPQTVVNAVHAADLLIGSLVVPPVGNGYLAPTATSGLEGILDQFNEGGTLNWPLHCSD